MQTNLNLFQDHYLPLKFMHRCPIQISYDRPLICERRLLQKHLQLPLDLLTNPNAQTINTVCHGSMQINHQLGY